VPDIRTRLKRLIKKQAKNRARDLTMRQVLSVKKTRMFPSWKQWKQLPRVLSGSEKRFIAGSLSVAIISLITMSVGYVSTHRVIIPAVGGTYTEGLVGEPLLINPLYSINNDVDQDLARLVYSGLLKWDPTDGFVPDLAESLEINEDATVYTLKIRDNAKFHNGEDVLARDVIFTINAIQNPTYRSPLADNFFQATVVQEDDRTISFILEEPFAPFPQHLTVGILPAGLWADILPQNAPLASLNIQPIGSGPYKFAEFAKDKKGSIRNYTLERNADYYGQAPYIELLTFKFYADSLQLADALENKNVEGASVVNYEQLSTARSNKNINLHRPNSPQESVLYFNQEISPVLSDVAIRSAIAQAINKAKLVDSAHDGKANVMEGFIPEGMIGHNDQIESTFNPDQANRDLDEAGYTMIEGTNTRKVKRSLQDKVQTDEDETDETESSPIATIKLTLTTVDTLEMQNVAELIKEDLTSIGIELDIRLVRNEFMFGEVIEPKNFELLLTHIMLEADPDPYVFWHSSQNEGGLNLVDYENDDVDTLLEEARSELDETVRIEKYQQFQELLAKDIPAVFLYQSKYAYALSSKIISESIENIMIPSDRFAQIEEWYIKTKKALR
jgi:peptide/nickel transport system substrate-binding protein